MGWPVSHSLSPSMHNAAFAALGLDWVYVPLPVAPERLADAVRGLAALGFAGSNATIPHKTGLVPLMDELTLTAAAIASVNTIIVREDGSLLGDSTDGYGFLADLWDHGVAVTAHAAVQRASPSLADGLRPDDPGRPAYAPSTRPTRLCGRALVIGAGGAARAIVYALAERGAVVAVANRTRAAADELCALIARALPAADVTAHPFPDALPALAAESDLIVNTTSLGLHGDADGLPWDPAVSFRPDQVAYDLIYNVPTPFLALAQASGALAINGLGMLVHQGAASFELWTGLPAPVDVMYAAVREHQT